MLIKIVNHASRYMASTEESWFRLACAHDQIGEVVEAEHLYRSILERNAHYTPARLRLVALLRRDRYRDNDALALLGFYAGTPENFAGRNQPSPYTVFDVT